MVPPEDRRVRAGAPFHVEAIWRHEKGGRHGDRRESAGRRADQRCAAERDEDLAGGCRRDRSGAAADLDVHRVRGRGVVRCAVGFGVRGVARTARRLVLRLSQQRRDVCRVCRPYVPVPAWRHERSRRGRCARARESAFPKNSSTGRFDGALGGEAGSVQWGEFEAHAARLAAVGRRMLGEPGVVLVVTIRRDGTPRLSPVEPLFWEDDLWLSMGWGTRKAEDLARDARLLVHSIVTSRDGTGGEFKLRGRAVAEDTSEIHHAYAAVVATQLGWEPEPGRLHLWRVDIGDVTFIRWDDTSNDQYVTRSARRNRVRPTRDVGHQRRRPGARARSARLMPRI